MVFLACRRDEKLPPQECPVLRVFSALFVLEFVSVSNSYAAQFGDFTYEDHGTYIEITDYPDEATGELVIPCEIVGKPVTVIGDEAFRLTGLSSVTIPEGVTRIGWGAFSGAYQSFGAYSLLTSVVVPGSVTSIGRRAFDNCTSLTSMYFHGDAPLRGERILENADNAIVYYQSGAKGWR